MVIDFHTHVFPDTLAERAIKVLYDEADGQFEPSHNGTVSGLIHTMNAAGIDISVNMPVITRQSQTTSTNQWAVETCSDRIISFGAVFPHTDDYQRDIDFVVSLGLKGIKFHAEYQHFVLDDPQMLRIYDYALAQGLIILHHGGYDPAFPHRIDLLPSNS
ncbi:MAG: hypothetical protein FWD45_01195 [Coriobacteriia bacterium]|nr:hypothetical protein [Coriobacteriia bacterium]